MDKRSKLSVFYDGECPLCVREIGFFRKRQGAESIRWIDVSQLDKGEVSPGLSKCDALSRFHVRDQHGTLFSGARAFIKIWETLPGFRLLARMARIPIFPPILEKLYLGFLKIRPVIQTVAKMFLRMTTRQSSRQS